MPDIQQTPIFQENGNMSLQKNSAAMVEIQFLDDNGVSRDVSARTYYFECGGLRILLQNGSASDKKTLTITRTQVTSLGHTKLEYIFLDETAGFELSDSIMAGELIVRR